MNTHDISQHFEADGSPRIIASRTDGECCSVATGSAFRRIGWSEAERILGGRVNRRKAFYFCDDPQMMEYLCGGPVFEYSEWTTSCSGCFETEDGHPVGKYPWDAKAHCHVGGGCSECGYTGKRRDGWHSPAQLLPNT